MLRRTFYVDNGAGWLLCLKRSHEPGAVVSGRRPVVIVPGYGMNSFIFGYHPRGPSMIDLWVRRGHEVWTADLRGQGASRPLGRRARFGLSDLALVDLPAALRFVVAHTLTGVAEPVVVGCSLGGALAYAHAGLHAEPLLGGLVAMGAPLRWEAIHPGLRVLSTSPWLSRSVAWPPTRVAARLLLPALARWAPALLGAYLNPDHVDLSAARELLLTVDELHAQLNVELGAWARGLDLELAGTNVTVAFERTRLPLLCVVGVGDGLVPEATALSACHRPAPARTEVLRVGSPEDPWPHADLFAGRRAAQAVFRPVARWLEALPPAGSPGP